ncbi:SHOCT domain-containing protein [Natrialbaceae archaeon A-CW1-1]
MSGDPNGNTNALLSIIIVGGLIVLFLVLYNSFGTATTVLAMFGIAFTIFAIEYLRKGEDAIEEFDIITPTVEEIDKQKREQYYKKSDNDYPENFIELIDKAESPTVTADCLTNNVSKEWSISYLPVIDYLHEGEQPHYHFIHGSSIRKNGTLISSHKNFRTSILLTSHRALVVSGQDGIDFIDIISYENVSTCRLRDKRRSTRFIIGTKDTTYQMGVDNAERDELENAGRFVGAKTNSPPDVNSDWLTTDSPKLRTTALKTEAVVDDGLRQKVQDKQRSGWKIAEIDNGDGYVVMYKSKGGGVGRHGLVGLTTGLWTFGAGNYVYEKATRRRNREKITLRADQQVETATKNSSPSASDKVINNDAAERLRKLNELHTDEIITQEEFEEKKAELLNEI